MCGPIGATKPTSRLTEEEKWIESFDLDAFTDDVRALGEQLERQQGMADVRHLNKMILWSNICAWVGILSMGFGVNPISIVTLSTWTFTRWTMIAHHTCHGGYDKCYPDGSNNRFHRFRFALGSLWRRVCDWLDWMMPEAWNVEHNNRHHYCLSEVTDPDLVERNFVDIRDAKVPLVLKYIVTLIIILTWKWYYYAPNTYKELKLAMLRREGKATPKVHPDPADPYTMYTILVTGTPFCSVWEFFSIVVGPYMILHFFLLPLPLLFIEQGLSIGNNMYSNAVQNLLYAELLTNAHAFLVIATNHTGNDMYRFRSGCRPYSGSFYIRQVLASVNFHMGTDLIDFVHGFLNYQIEHHLYPNLSMRSYQKAAPLVREICKKHGVPYIQQNVFCRLTKTINIVCGTASMKWFPEHYERKYLEMDEMGETKKKTKRADQAERNLT